MKTISFQQTTKRSSRIKFSGVLFLLWLSLLFNIAPVQAQKPLDSFQFSTDGKVNATVISGNFLYLGGDFNNIGKKIGPVAFFHDTSSFPLRGMPLFGDMRASWMSDRISAVAPDGEGGWYVGGYFSRVNNRKDSLISLVHILPDHSIDRRFIIHWEDKRQVNVLKTEGIFLYVGGEFSVNDENGKTHYNVMRINKGTGKIDPNWNPALTSKGHIEKIEIGKDKIFLAGWPGWVEGFEQDALVAVDKTTGKRISFPSTSSVTAMKLMGDTLILGQPDMYWSAYPDGFGYIFHNAALLDTTRDLPEASMPQQSNAYCLIADGKGGWYASGYFNNEKGGIYHLDNKAKVLKKFSQNKLFYFSRLWLIGNNLYAACSFQTPITVNGEILNYLFKLNPETGAIDNTLNLHLNGPVKSLAVKGDTLYVGGEFDSIAGKARNGLAAINLKTNNLMPWTPVINFDNYNAGYTGPERHIDALFVKNDTLYVAGKFQVPAPQFTKRQTGIYGLARYNMQTGDLDTTFYIHTSYFGNPYITSMAFDGNKIYIAGIFDLTKNKLQVKNAGIVDLSTKTLQPVNQDLDFTHTYLIYNYQVTVKDGIVYFWGLNATQKSTGKKRNYLVSLYTHSHNLTKWNPGFDNGVNALAFSNDKLLISGDFYFLKAYHNNFAVIKCNTKKFVPLAFNIKNVYALALTDKYIFMGGDFYRFGDSVVNGLCRLDRKSFNFTTFKHNIRHNNSRPCISNLVIGDKGLYAVGIYSNKFTNVGGVERQNICLIDPETGKLKAWNPPHFNGTAARVFSFPGYVVIAGDFGLMPSWKRHSIAKINLKAHRITDWNPELSGYYPAVYSLLVSSDTVYVGGKGIYKVNSKDAGELCTISASSGTLLNGFTPVKIRGSYINILAKQGKYLYAAGDFTKVNDTSRNYIVKLDATTGAVENWDAHLDAGWTPPVKTILPLDTAVYIGGNALTINGNDQQANLLKVSPENGDSITSYPCGPIRSLAMNKRGDIAAGGYFGKSLLLLDKDTLIQVEKQPEFGSGITKLSAVGNTFLVAGNGLKEQGTFTKKPGFFAYDPIHDTAFAAFSMPVLTNYGKDLTAFAFTDSIMVFGGEFVSPNTQTMAENLAFMSIPHLYLEPGVTSWSPKVANNTDPFSISFYGSGFGSYSDVQLTKGETTYAPDSMQTAYNKIIAYFNGEDFTTGKWDVILKVNNTTLKTYPGAFQIKKGDTTETWADWIGPNRTLAEKPTTYYLLYGNRGNRDAYGVFLYLAVKDDQTVVLPSHVKPPAMKGVDWDTIPHYVKSDYFLMEPYQGKVYTIFLPYLPAGYEGAFKLTVTSESSSHPMRVAISKPIYKNYNELLGNTTKSSQGIGYDFFSCMYSVAGIFADLTPGISCAKAAFDNTVMLAVSKYHSHESVQAEDVANSIGMTIIGCIPGETTMRTGYKIAKGMASMYGSAGDVSGAVGACTDFVKDLNKLFFDVAGYYSHDPNAKYGPAGKGSSVYVGSKAPYNYIVTFENDSAASAPAQRVIITDTLDKGVFDISSFKPTGFGFGDTTYLYKKGEDTVYIDLRPAKQAIVKVFYHLDPATGILTWTFLTLNPNTYELIDDINNGFLPPNRKSPEGEGNVFYSVKPLENLAEGTEIKNSAHIVFDWNKAIPTDTWKNVTDNIAPESAVESLPEYEVDKDFTVKWNGSDAGSGIFSYTVFVSENDSAYYPWITDTHDTSAVFSGDAGVTYKFYTVASDSAGNKEAVPGSYDAKTRVSGTGIDKFGEGDKMQFRLFPNPAKDQLSVNFYLPESSEIRLDVISLCGRPVIKPVKTQGMRGTNKTVLDISRLPAGYYFVRILTKYGVQTRKVVVQ